jgi:hypothetical protein
MREYVNVFRAEWFRITFLSITRVRVNDGHPVTPISKRVLNFHGTSNHGHQNQVYIPNFLQVLDVVFFNAMKILKKMTHGNFDDDSVHG